MTLSDASGLDSLSSDSHSLEFDQSVDADVAAAQASQPTFADIAKNGATLSVVEQACSLVEHRSLHR
ncbi:MAG: hypothetical protein U0414_32335 [Polyangiaceae bacterium]